MNFRLILPFTIIIFMCIPCYVYAYDDYLLDKYDSETIHLYYSVAGNGFVKDGRIINISLLGTNLAEAMIGSTFALEEMQKARKYKIISISAGSVSTILSITGVIMAILDTGENRTFEITSIVLGAVSGIISDGFNRAAMSATNRAVWLYNRDVMSGQLETSGIERN
ncbi:hypothetical protein GF312_10690 [Candidatus Poribacteria bacterium]|nr:hypothetical protein [Candidatus Poribacteria bacterium]